MSHYIYALPHSVPKRLPQKVHQGSSSLAIWFISRKSRSAERLEAVSVTIILSFAVTKYGIAYEIGDLMGSEM